MSNEVTKTEEYAVDPNSIKELVTSAAGKKQFAMALPKHLSADRFLRVALTAFTRTPKLLQCTKESLTESLMDCSALGLEPDGRKAHLIPYGKVCKLIVDYKGLVDLARRSGEIADIHADVVCENDFFEYSFGTNGNLEHKPAIKEKGVVIAAYSYVKLKDGSSSYEVMNLEEINAIRKRSKASGSGPWVTDWNEMAKKTVFRRHSKWLPVSSELMKSAVDKDYDVPIDIMKYADAGKPEVVQPKALSEDKPEPEKKKSGAPEIKTEKEPEPEIEELSKKEKEKQETGDDGYFDLLAKARELKKVVGEKVYNAMKVPALKEFVKVLEDMNAGLKTEDKTEREPGIEG